MALDKPNAHSNPGAAAEGSPELRALNEALAQLLAPVAQLAVARGLPYAAVQELLKRAFVEAASAAHAGLASHRKVSRIAASTGINRREVTRLTQRTERRVPRSAVRSLASEICLHWHTRAPWCDDAGRPRALPRLGPAPSFETLAHEITRDVHPRTLLDELCRLGLARFDEAADSVALAGDAFVPSGDRARMLAALGRNVGDHLRAAVDNVLVAGRPPHLEQAVYAEGLSEESLEALRALLREQWARVRQAVVPALEARIAADAAAGKAAANGQPLARMRLGLYAYHEVPGAASAPGSADPPARAVPARRASVRASGSGRGPTARKKDVKR